MLHKACFGIPDTICGSFNSRFSPLHVPKGLPNTTNPPTPACGRERKVHRRLFLSCTLSSTIQPQPAGSALPPSSASNSVQGQHHEHHLLRFRAFVVAVATTAVIETRQCQVVCIKCGLWAMNHWSCTVLSCRLPAISSAA